jgi:hypothetical protein
VWQQSSCLRAVRMTCIISLSIVAVPVLRQMGAQVGFSRGTLRSLQINRSDSCCSGSGCKELCSNMCAAKSKFVKMASASSHMTASSPGSMESRAEATAWTWRSTDSDSLDLSSDDEGRRPRWIHAHPQPQTFRPCATINNRIPRVCAAQ